MKKNILFTAIVIISILPEKLIAQDIKKNSAYTELLGNGIIYSINYDRIIPISDQLKLAPRIGFEFLPRIKRNNKTFGQKYGNWTFPFELNLLWAQKPQSKNFAEAGLGIGLFSMIEGYSLNQKDEIINTYFKMGKVTTLRLGFRHQKPEGGLMYRAGILVRLSQDDFSRSRVGDDLFYKLWPGFSVGYTF